MWLRFPSATYHSTVSEAMLTAGSTGEQLEYAYTAMRNTISPGERVSSPEAVS